VEKKNSALCDSWVTYSLVSRLPRWLRGASNKTIWSYLVMRLVGAILGYLLDTSGGIISLYRGAYDDSAPRFLIWGSRVRIMVGVPKQERGRRPLSCFGSSAYLSSYSRMRRVCCQAACAIWFAGKAVHSNISCAFLSGRWGPTLMMGTLKCSANASSHIFKSDIILT